MTARPQTDALPRLEDQPLLILDCQSTGASPERGHPVEIAWARLPAGELRVTSLLLALPPGERLPRRIRRLTGLDDDDLQRAGSPEAAWHRLCRATPPGGIGVAHFARFERAFLEALHAEHGRGDPFPLDLVCTYEIVCRLMPDLPRRGLRAVAGHFGHLMDGAKRAAAHVRATAVVWSRLARRLREEAGVRTLADLRAWLAEAPASRRAGRAFAVARETRLDLPEAPGVYRLRGRGGQVLYLGKATSLRRRVNSYFQKRRHGAERTPELLTQVFDVDVTVTPSALEAALREADEIKRHAPAYNVALRPRARRTWFARVDLGDAAPASDARHPLGPLPGREALDALVALRGLLRDAVPSPDDLRWRRALDLPAERPVEAACLGEGLTLFLRRHGLDGDGGLELRSVRRLGARLWHAHLLRRAERRAARSAARQAAPPAEDRVRDPTLRDPRQVARRLEAVLLHCAHGLRRARWFLRLSECVLRWHPNARAEGEPARLLVFERGRLAHGRDVPATGPLPVPPGADRDAGARRAAFDDATYDRMRVLTTELRRLVAAGRPAQLGLGPRAVLDRCGLARRLYWL